MFLPQKHKGGHSELVACAWLLGNGYEVFRNVSQHGAIDVVAICDGVIRLFNVKSSRSSCYWTPDAAAVALEFIVVENGVCTIVALPEHRDNSGPPMPQLTELLACSGKPRSLTGATGAAVH